MRFAHGSIALFAWVAGCFAVPPEPLVWDSPSADSWGSMPIGNGDLGANVWVEPSGDLVLLLSKTDAWDEVNRLCKLGRVRIKTDPPLFAEGGAFEQRLDLETGTIRINTEVSGVRCQVSVWIDVNRPVVRVEIAGAKPFTTSVAHETWRTKERELTGGERRSAWGERKASHPVKVVPDTVLNGQPDRIVFFHRNPSSVWKTNMQLQLPGETIDPAGDPLLHRTFGALVRGEGLASEGRSRLVSGQRANRFVVSIHALTAQTPTPESWVDQLTQQTDRTDRISPAQARAEHDAWWKAFWNRSWIVVSGSHAPLPRNEQPWSVGHDSDGNSRFAGGLAGPRVLGRAMSGDEVANLAHAERPDETELRAEAFTNALTMAAWVKPAAGEAGRILDKHPLRVSRGIVLDTHPGLALRLILGDHTMTLSDCLKTGEWQHVAATADASAGWRRIYLDGKLVKEEHDEPAHEAVSRGYALQRWINACGGRGGAPIKFNGSIFNVDCVRPIQSYNGSCHFDADFREWGSSYWWQNTRLPYWGMLASGDYDLMQPMFRMYRDALPLRVRATRAQFGHDGAYYPETMEFWGMAASSDYRWSDENPDGRKVNKGLGAAFYYQGVIENVALMLAYCDSTGDTAFRDGNLLPIAEEVLKFYTEHWPRKDGKLHFYPIAVLEVDQQQSTNPMPELAGLHDILPRLIACTPDERQRDAWRQMLADLPPIPRTADRLLMAEQVKPRPTYYENPELYAVFPYGLYGVGKPDLEMALNTWRLRRNKGSGGWRQDAIQAAMLGLADAAQAFVTQNFRRHASGFRFPAMWGPNYDWIPDQDHGCSAMIALQKMLLQTDGKRILIAPAWPSTWDCAFKLHAPYRTTVEGRVADGQVVVDKVTPASRRKDIVILGMAKLALP